MTQATANQPIAEPIATPAPAIGKRGPHPTALGMASGLLLAMAFDPVGAWWLAWVGMVPFLLLVRSGRSAAMCYFGAWVGGLAFWLVSVEWVRDADPSAWPGWLALALVLSFWWPSAMLLIRGMVRGAQVALDDRGAGGLGRRRVRPGALPAQRLPLVHDRPEHRPLAPRDPDRRPRRGLAFGVFGDAGQRLARRPLGTTPDHGGKEGTTPLQRPDPPRLGGRPSRSPRP